MNPYRIFDSVSFDAGKDCGNRHGFMLAARSLRILSPTSTTSINGFVEMAREAHHRYLRALRAKIERCEDCMTRPALPGDTRCESCRDNRAEAAYERSLGETFRGVEARVFEAERMALIQRELK